MDCLVEYSYEKLTLEKTTSSLLKISEKKN